MPVLVVEFTGFDPSRFARLAFLGKNNIHPSTIFRSGSAVLGVYG